MTTGDISGSFALAVAVTLLVAAAGKARSRDAEWRRTLAAKSLAGIGIDDPKMGRYLMAGSEAMLAGWLFSTEGSVFAAALCAALFATGTVLEIVSLIRDGGIPCGCFGARKTVNAGTIARNFAVLAAALSTAVLGRPAFTGAAAGAAAAQLVVLGALGANLWTADGRTTAAAAARAQLLAFQALRLRETTILEALLRSDAWARFCEERSGECRLGERRSRWRVGPVRFMELTLSDGTAILVTCQVMSADSLRLGVGHLDEAPPPAGTALRNVQTSLISIKDLPASPDPARPVAELEGVVGAVAD